jgi:hypothetical protein
MDTDFSPLLFLQAAGPARLGGDLVVLALVAGTAFVGLRHGLFVATLVGFQSLASAIAALALAGPVADLVIPADVVPSAWRLAAAYAVTFTTVFVGIRLAIGAAVPEIAMALSPWPDGVGGAVIGAFAGWLLAGVVLVGWSMAGVPDSWRFSPAGLAVDPGRWLLGTFARCVETEPERRAVLFAGEAASGGPDGPRCSEPFLDINRNGQFDDGEPYLDVDGNGAFTPSLGYTDLNGDGRRDLGLFECHRLGAWSGIMVWHAPRVTSPARVELERPPANGHEIYRATADDPDGAEALLFAVRSGGTDETSATAVEIDPHTGVVVLVRPPADQVTRVVKFTVLVTDPTGLTDELPVRVVW